MAPTGSVTAFLLMLTSFPSSASTVSPGGTRLFSMKTVLMGGDIAPYEQGGKKRLAPVTREGIWDSGQAAPRQGRLLTLETSRRL